jgi:hypothetical protein
MSGGSILHSAEADLQAALLEVVRADAGVQGLLGTPARVFDSGGGEPVFPYAELERHEVSDRGSSRSAGQAHTISFGVRTRFGGRQAAKEIIGALRVAVEQSAIMVVGQRVILIQTIYSDVMRTADLREFRGLMRIRIIIEEAG